ncbi:Ribokinase-like protein [Teratosphaeria nubilosa]|uniref:Ribokinase n=1 Tax=Teratosphaeria nubilosa TaxID=161662 RepID=A0A6G1LAX8_9PEZI|nr:Ribokinase-like protein [Teratosphaeria nubilosa]
MAARRIAVIGSLNIDMITRTSRIPEAGETLTAESFDTGFGGKGANQAVASARLASNDIKVQMVGNVGNDGFGNDYFEAMEKEGIDGSRVQRVRGQKTGVSVIIVDEATGENRILFTKGANYAFEEVADGSVGKDWDLVPSNADVVVFQLEIPLPVVLHNIKAASEKGKHVIFNPAPASTVPDAAFSHIDTLIMNESESAILSGPTEDHNMPSTEELAAFFLKKGVKDTVIITLGGQGLVYVTKSGESGRVPAKKVKVVDTTAAGDTFVGAYAVARVKDGFSYNAALDFATTAAAKSVERHGAMAAIPYLSDLA